MLGTFVQRVARLGDGLLVVLTDITEQRRTEAELRNFADLVAHDLREPITGIAHLITVLERRADEPPSPDVLRLLRSSAERAHELIEGVLSYARAGKLSSVRVDLGGLMAEVGEDLGPLLAETRATLEAGELPEVDGDPRHLRRVLQNLVGNALRFRGEEPPRVEVFARRRDAEWVITVRDNGVGVDPDQATRIFDMFARASTAPDGTGIGWRSAVASSRRTAASSGSSRPRVAAAPSASRSRADAANPQLARRRTASSTAATATTYAAWVPRLVATTSAGQRQGGGVRPSSGNSDIVAVISVAPNAALAHGSRMTRCSPPCRMPKAEP